MVLLSVMIIDVFDFVPGLREHVRKDGGVVEPVQAAGEETVALDHGGVVLVKNTDIECVGHGGGVPHSVDHLEDLVLVREE